MAHRCGAFAVAGLLPGRLPGARYNVLNPEFQTRRLLHFLLSSGLSNDAQILASYPSAPARFNALVPKLSNNEKNRSRAVRLHTNWSVDLCSACHFSKP